MKHTDIGPSPPWYEDDGIEYVGADVTFNQTIEQTVYQLVSVLEDRAARLRSPNVSLPDVMKEIRDQMTVAAAQSEFGQARELHDIAFTLLMAEDSAKRAI